RGFGTKEQIVAKAHAGAAALLMHSDLREVERLSAIETARVKEELFRNLNHELRTPLNIINAMSRKLAEQKLDPIHAHGLKQIAEAARRLTHLLEEVLFLAGLDTEERTKKQVVPFRPAALLAGMAAEFETKARARGLELRCSWDEDVPVRFNGDSEKIGAILRQLVENAIKFSRDAEVSLRVQDVTPASRAEHGTTASYTLRFAVTDHGIGIAPEQHERIFEPFYQCDTSRAREYEGAGLGLSVARKLAAILGSEVKVESEVGVGSTFYFDLDLTPEISAQGTSARAAHAMFDPEDKQQKRQLDHGDEVQLLKLLRKLEHPLTHSRPRPCSVIAASLAEKHWPRVVASEVDKLVILIDKYRYPEALEIFHRLQSQVEALVETGAGQDVAPE
ncbi:MAG: HAMP domain-containing sensor histidine kinase, partial [Desulfuromonadaceae bacterium]|nr:HAMP domain-containing sensor histidine kinase [Desulfuromonadaceae bacterium]